MNVTGKIKTLLGLLTLVLFILSIGSMAQAKGKRLLRFNEDRSFKIVQFTDIQDDEDIDPRTVQLIEAVLDAEKPDLVVFTGDNITGGCETAEDVKAAINNFAQPVNDREIPWLITFGNHDEDSTDATGVDKDEQLEIYMSYEYNINKVGPKDVAGTGNMFTFILGSKKYLPVFTIWALDSGKYAPDEIAGQSLDEYPGWDWIKNNQIAWYVNASKAIEKKLRGTIPGFMFFHIPLWEFDTMWNMKDIVDHEIVGEKNESVCPGPFNSGLFAALLERGDVKGVFVGHDHVNSYIGNYYGIYLGYAANAGFGTYGLSGDERDRLRGARVFELNEDDPENFTTRMVFAADYGIQ